MVDATLDPTFPLEFDSNLFGRAMFKPEQIYSDFSEINSTYDIVIISCNSLQDFQAIAANLATLMHQSSVILVESTGYINLEPFVKLNFGDRVWDNLAIASIMNEMDVKKHWKLRNKFLHKLRNNDNRIYLGTSVANKSINTHEGFLRVYKLFQLVTEDSSNKIALLKLILPKEFMTYQWKLALSRIVFNPLLIIFELDSPSKLSQQILCKPLITGILSECLKIIKKMDCKLVKGFENEANLINYWSNLYPEVKNDEGFVNSPLLFYNFYHQFGLEIDLLLLQPILLGDDNGVRTPYLENLYSMLCQFVKISESQDSIFFQRIGTTPQFNDEELNQKLNQLNLATHDLNKLDIKANNLNSAIKEKEIFKNQLDKDINSKQTVVQALSSDFTKQQERFNQEQANYFQLLKEIELLKQEKAQLAAMATATTTPGTLGASTNSSPQKALNVPKKPAGARDSVMTDNLEDLTDIAVYSAQLNGEHIDLNSPNPKSANTSFQQDTSYSSQDGADQMHSQNFSAPPPTLNGGPGLNGAPAAPSAPAAPAGAAFTGAQVNQFTGAQPQFTGGNGYSGYQNGYQNGQGTNGYQNGQGYANGATQAGQMNPQLTGMSQNGPVNSGRLNSMNSTRPYQQQPGYNGAYAYQNGSVPNQPNQPNQMPYQNGSVPNQPSQMPYQNGSVPNQPNQAMNRYSVNQRGRLNSLQSNNYLDNMAMPQWNQMSHMGQMNPMQFQMMQQQLQNMQLQQQGQPVQGHSQPRSRTANRRSGLNTMHDNLNGLDMGGRGGMPMPGGNKANRKSTSGIPVTSTQQYGTPHSKSMSTGNLMEQHLKLPPGLNESNGSLNPLSAPQEVRDTSNDILINVPTESAKPLGGISSSNTKDGLDKKKKKKKGLFR